MEGQLITGPNGGRIFLPSAGCRGNVSLFNAGVSGQYWESCHDREWQDGQTYFYFNSEEREIGTPSPAAGAFLYALSITKVILNGSNKLISKYISAYFIVS